MSEATLQRWQPPPVGAARPSAAEESSRQALTAQRLAEIEALAREQGYARGREEGLKAGRAEAQQAASRLQALLDGVTPQIGLLDDALEEQLAALVIAAVRQFVRRELTLQPGEVVRVVRECLAALPASAARIRLHLNPSDAELVRDALHVAQFERDWTIVDDPNLARGGARLESETSTVDASVETRLNTLIARLLGDDRRAPADD